MTIESALEKLRRPPPEGTVEAVELGVGLVAGFARYEAPIGDVVVVFTPAGVRAVRRPEDLDDLGDRVVEATPPTAWADRIPRAIEEGRPRDLPIDLSGVTPFRRSVLEVAETIPRGEVRPYGWLARRIGRPTASRAVGSAMASNPVPLIIPCHRVIRSDGRVGAYSLGGPDTKWALLTHEGADPARLEALADAGIRFIGSDTTEVFCLPTCRGARRISRAHEVRFRNEAEATDAGYRPCRVCLPTG